MSMWKSQVLMAWALLMEAVLYIEYVNTILSSPSSKTNI
jgi:hypothetical protein